MQNPSTSPSFAHTAEPTEIDAHALAALVQSSEPPIVVDVREASEVAMAMLPQARHLALGQIISRHKDVLGGPTERLVVTYCHHGVRSQQARAQLRMAGYGRVLSLKGGIDAWATDIDARVGRY